MTLTVLLTPWYRRTSVPGRPDDPQAGSINATAILNHESARIRHLADRARRLASSSDPTAVLEAAHSLIREEVRAVYALEENTPASHTLARGFGSCSQRLAVLESVARSIGVPTRVRVLLVDRSFWYPRFPRISMALPDEVILAWPQFDINGWLAASELFGSIGCRGGGAFTNRGSETLFEAVGRCAIDWDGQTHESEFDLSRFVRRDYGYFTDRDDAFRELGQTLCTPARLVADPILRRIAA